MTRTKLFPYTTLFQSDSVETNGTTHTQNDRFSLTFDNSTINDTYEHYEYDVVNGENTETHYLDTYALGNAITLDVESDIVIQNNSHIAGITLTQGYQERDNTPYRSEERRVGKECRSRVSELHYQKRDAIRFIQHYLL